MSKKVKNIILITIIFSATIIIQGNLVKSISTNIENEPIFTLYKEDGETFNPIEGTKFVITDLEGKNVIGTDGKVVGDLENIEGIDYYVLTTDKKGYIKANLPKGLYKAIEIYAKEGYILEQEEKNRTYYFEIGLQDFDINDWIQGVRGYSWNYINSSIGNKKGGIIAVGSISEYEPEVTGGFYNGIDLNSDGIIDEISEGENDGIIISYDENGNYLWSETFGGIYDDCCKQIIQTKDGGYVVIGYISSPVIYLNGKIITDLSKSNYNVANKDGFILKINENGEYEWGTRIGGTLDDEIVKVMEVDDGNIYIIGNFQSDMLNLYEYNSNYKVVNNLKNKGEVNSFIASYSVTGKHNWSKGITGDNYIDICDITQVENNIAVAVNYKGTANLDQNKCNSSYLPDYENAIIINYSMEGRLNWFYDMYSAQSNMYSNYKYIRANSITKTKNNDLIVAISYTDVVKGREDETSEYSTICKSGINGIVSNLIVLSSKGKFIKDLYKLNSQIPGYMENSVMVFNDVTSTSNNEILLGGYYYSNREIDVDKDGSYQEKYDFKCSSGLSSNGFIIKLDLNGIVNFSDCMNGNNAKVYASSQIVSVNESKDGKIVAGGNFFWNTLTTKNFYNRHSGKDMSKEYYLTKVGNVDGFVFYETENVEILKPEKITVNNYKKKFNITTQVNTHEETDDKGNQIQVKGGKISGEYNQIINGTQYNEDGIHYVETVKYDETSTKEITITPEKGYKVAKILLNNEEYNNFTVDDNGNIILPVFTNVRNNIHIEVEFCKIILSLSELPLTGSKSTIKLDLIAGIFICIGIYLINYATYNKGTVRPEKVKVTINREKGGK